MHGTGHRVCAFFNCIETGGKSAASGEVERDALAVALAAERSMETDEPVAVSAVC